VFARGGNRDRRRRRRKRKRGEERGKMHFLIQAHFWGSITSEENETLPKSCLGKISWCMIHKAVDFLLNQGHSVLRCSPLVTQATINPYGIVFNYNH